MSDFRNLIAYQKAYELAMEIFEISKGFPKIEVYSLTHQIRRSSRSVCANIGEAYKKRKYPAHFISKLSDSDAENTETQIWLDFSKDCQYITIADYEKLSLKNTEVGKLIWYMIHNKEKFL